MILIGISFLQDVGRIARRDYTPSDDDVVRARLRTLGVQEHRILFETGAVLHPHSIHTSTNTSLQRPRCWSRMVSLRRWRLSDSGTPYLHMGR